MADFEKFVMDADQLGTLHHLAKGIDMSENGQAMGAIREVGPECVDAGDQANHKQN